VKKKTAKCRKIFFGIDTDAQVEEGAATMRPETVIDQESKANRRRVTLMLKSDKAFQLPSNV